MSHNYLKLIKVGTKYANRMNRLSNRIFGEVYTPTTPKSMKVVKLLSAKPIQKQPEIVKYYPRLEETYTLMMKLREYGLYRDEYEDFKDEQLRMRALRGKRIWLPHAEWKKNQEKNQ